MGGNEEFCFKHVSFYSPLDVKWAVDMQVWGSGERIGPETEILETSWVGDILSHESE